MGSEAPKSYEQDLVKYICCNCMEEFIIGQTTAEKVKTLHCPFCGQKDHLKTESWLGGEDLEELELGCFGIGYEENSEGQRVINKYKALEAALSMEKDGLTEERKNELYYQYVCGIKEFYTIDELEKQYGL